METSFVLLLVLIVTFTIIHIVQGQDQQQGFISLNCGLSATARNLTSNGLLFSSDENFVSSGKIAQVQDSLAFAAPYLTLRYFPDGIRNCYNLNVDKDRKYLIRALFVYGNYDGRNINPVFDIYLGPNLWDTIDLRQVNGTNTEIFYIPTSNPLQICLVKTGEIIPIISALELRPIRNDSYITESGSLKLLRRRYLTQSNSFIRYTEDVYDRIWRTSFQTNWREIDTALELNSSNIYALPEQALKSAATPINYSEPLTIEWISENPNDEYYYYVHFAEIQNFLPNETREFNMLWNAEVVTSEPLVPKKLEITTKESLSPSTCNDGKCSFQLLRTNRSTLPPLLNAFKLYTVIQFPQSETDENDVVAMKNIQANYTLSKINWQGDPCVPQQFMWDGLNCSNTDMSTPPRITSLNLSLTGLTGTIAADIENLTELKTLDLSNNKLTGEVPEFLGNMKSLVLINISGNDLSGLIPRSLKINGVVLFAQGNPKLCLHGSCKKAKFPVVIVVLVAIVTVLVIVVLVLLLVLCRKKKR